MFCFFTKELRSVSGKKYDCQFTSLKKDGKNVTGTIRLSNRSGKKIAGWELSMDTNFQITSLEDEYANYGFEYYTDDDEEDLWSQNICANGENINLGAGETKEISFTGICPADKPKLDKGFTLLQQCDVDDTETWTILENRYGGSYGKMDTYLVADTVFGTDLFFVFDEKTTDGYTATAELTNVIPDPSPDSEEYLAQSISDWEIYLECEDTIESITGAEIASHEGNVYCIRTTDPTQWIEPYSFTTFQVKVSCPAGIRPLGKTYLKRAKILMGYDSDTTEEEREFSFSKDADVYQQSAGTKWLSYNELYDPFSDIDDAEDEEWDGFIERQEWGKKMGRMPE